MEVAAYKIRVEELKSEVAAYKIRVEELELEVAQSTAGAHDI